MGTNSPWLNWHRPGWRHERLALCLLDLQVFHGVVLPILFLDPLVFFRINFFDVLECITVQFQTALSTRLHSVLSFRLFLFEVGFSC